MAIWETPIIGLSLLEHSSDGAIFAKGGAYIGHTYVSANVVQAFTTASSVLTSMGSAVTGVATSPVFLAGAVLTVAAVGAYCYFYGVPATLASALAKVGLATSAKAGIAISIPKLAVALVLLGGAGYVTYRFYQSCKAARHAAGSEATLESGQATANAAFGGSVWSRFGSAMWSGIGDASLHAAKLAQEAVDALGDAGSAVAAAANDVAGAAYEATARAGRLSPGVIARWFARLRMSLHV